MSIRRTYLLAVMTAFSVSRILSLCLSGLFKTHWVRTSRGKYLIIPFFNERRGYGEGNKNLRNSTEVI